MTDNVQRKPVPTPRRRTDAEGNRVLMPFDMALMDSRRQCPAMSKRTGRRCKNFCSLGMKSCRIHGSGTVRAKVAAAERIRAAAGYAAALLVELMADPAVDVKLRADIARDILTRAGVEEAKRVQVDAGNSWLDILPKVFHEVPDEDVVDAEVLELAASPVPPADSDAARAAYLAGRNASTPEPKDWVERVDGPRPRIRRR